MDHKTCLFPCRTCGCPLYLKEVLSRHNAEDHVIEIKEWHCLHCNKSFHRDGNKILYRRNYEHGARSLSSTAAKIEGICYKKGKRNGNRNRNATLAIWWIPGVLESPKINRVITKTNNDGLSKIVRWSK